MELEAISGAATVALTSTIVFLLIAKSWVTVSRSIRSPSRFSGRILHEAAQRLRDDLDRLSSSQSTYLCGVLVFVMLFISSYELQAERLFVGYPKWQLYLQFSFLLLVFAFAAYRLAGTAVIRHRLKFLCDANIAIGQQLQQMCVDGTRVFHDVKTSEGIIDHVIVGQRGLYAINVIARKPAKDGHVELRDSSIAFSNSLSAHSIIDMCAKTAGLQKEIRELLGHDLRVRSVIAIPGWEINEQPDSDHLLVNERTVTMLGGWQDKTDNLMNEVVDALRTELTTRCARH